MSETPRVDAFYKLHPICEYEASPAFEDCDAWLDFARQLERALAQAQARCAELEKDAERYRWWRDKFWGTDEDLDEVNRLSCTSAEEWDAAIDAALKSPR